MNALAHSVRRWVAFWDRREAPHTLALLRILVAAVLLWDLLAAVGGDVITLLWAPEPVGAGSGLNPAAPSLVASWLGASARTASVVWSCAVASSALVLLGVAYRVTSWLWVLSMIELMRCQPTGDGIDYLLRIVLPILAMSGAQAAWSVDAWLRQRRRLAPQREVPAWPRHLLLLQLVWLYFSAAHHRGRSWWPQYGFPAIGNVLSDPHFARFSPGSLHALHPLMQLGTAITMLFELSAPLLLLLTWLDRNPGRGGKPGALVRRWKLRWVWLSIGVSLHLGIAFSMRIGIFPFAMLALYPAFVHPDELRWLLASGRAARPARQRAAVAVRPGTSDARE